MTSLKLLELLLSRIHRRVSPMQLLKELLRARVNGGLFRELDAEAKCIQDAQDWKRVSSSLRYSPQSACLKTTIPVGSRRFASAEERAVTPKPRGVLEHVSLFAEKGSLRRCDILVHRVDNDTLVLRAVLTPTSNMCLDNVTTVQERHLSVRLDPDLCASMRGDDVQSSDVEAELASLGQLADAVSKAQQVVSCYRGGQVGHVLAHVVDS